MRWIIKPDSSKKHLTHLQEVLGVCPIIAKLLVLRNIQSFDGAKAFFRPNLNHLHNPFLMKDMDKAVSRIQKALAHQENIMVYGDYDVDGTTSVALMSHYLKTHTPNIISYVPDRYSEGYGVSFKGIDTAFDKKVSLIITLDCGIKAIEKVAYAKSKGIDVIICDHHQPPKELPEAIAVLDPKRSDCNYPYKELCGCGVGFKLIQALQKAQGLPFDDLIPYLDLVLTAIAADIVPITGENRILAFFGLKTLNSTPRIGIKALMGHLKKPVFETSDVVFGIAPRINAAGRMYHGLAAVDLLLEQNLEEAKKRAEDIEMYNSDRKTTDRNTTIEALTQIKELKEEQRFTTVVYQDDWHKGVIGIVASRLIETYYRPTLVFTKSGDQLAASARSVKDFDVYKALEACKEYITQFGGHKYAAGLTLKPENYVAFKECFENFVATTINPELLEPQLHIDTEITLEQITPKLYRIIKTTRSFWTQ